MVLHINNKRSGHRNKRRSGHKNNNLNKRQRRLLVTLVGTAIALKVLRDITKRRSSHKNNKRSGHLNNKKTRLRRLKTSCSRSVSRRIAKEIRSNRRKPISQRRSRSQLQAIGFSKVRKARPKCRLVIRK